MDELNVCVLDENGQRVYSQDLHTRDIIKQPVKELLNNRSAAKRLSEQLYAGERIYANKEVCEQAKIHAICRAASKLENSDL